MDTEERASNGSLITGFVLIIGLLLAMAGVGLFYLQAMNQTITRIVDGNNERTRQATEMLIAARERALQLHAILQESDAFAQDSLVPRFHQLAGRFRGARDALLRMPLSPAERKILDEQGRHTVLGSNLQDEVLDLAIAGRREEAERKLVAEAIPAQNLAAVQMRRLLDLQVQGAHEAANRAFGQYRLARNLLITSSMIAALLAALVAVVVVRRQARLLARLKQANSELQQRVNERTEALAQAVKQLEVDIAERTCSQELLQQQYQQLETLHSQLKDAQSQLLQSDKLASIGQLAAGVAHEINNPIGYVHSNLGTLENYLNDLFTLISGYEATEIALPEQSPQRGEIAALKKKLDLPYLREDIPQLMNESRDGITRVRKIVQDLKDFSHLDSSPDWQYANLHRGLDSTLNIVHNEIKYRADVVKEYGELPDIECLPSQLNQVFMNLLVNAAHAIDGERGTITLRTGVEEGGREVWVEVIDTGKGIPEEILSRIFDPFFTTKPVGKGTGLGLSLAYGIIQKHCGLINASSEVGKGTTFRIVLPVQHPQQSGHPDHE